MQYRPPGRALAEVDPATARRMTCQGGSQQCRHPARSRRIHPGRGVFLAARQRKRGPQAASFNQRAT